MYNGETFDQDHLEEINGLIHNPINSIFSKDRLLFAQCSYNSIYHAKLRKATGYDNIPADVLRNEHCIDLLYKIINFAFESGEIPSHWLKGIINPIAKGDDPSCPLNYRPITLVSIACKIYANILNKRLCELIDEHETLSKGQNGFRKDRSCLDHIYTLHSIIKNRKHLRKDTFACFEDYKKAFDTIDRNCLWFKLLSHGIQGKVLHAVRSLYKSVECCAKVNEYFTDWFPVRRGVKQGCVLSPTPF